MVLEEWGKRIRQVVTSLMSAKIVDDALIKKTVNDLAIILIKSDVEISLVKRVQDNLIAAATNSDLPPGANRRKIIQEGIVRELMSLVTPKCATAFDPIRKTNKVVVQMLVGLQGSGKTTTCSKLAVHYKRKGWRVAVVCADTFRAGAFEQLKQNALKSKIPFYGTSTERDPAIVAENGVAHLRQEGHDMILVDTAGRHKQHDALFEEMTMIAKVVKPDNVLLVFDATNGSAMARNHVLAFHTALKIGSVVLTKLDGHAKGGGVISAVAASQAPISFVGTGEHLDQLETFRPTSFVSRLLGMGDMEGLFQILEDAKVTETNSSTSRLASKLTKGTEKVTFRDIREQLELVRQLGPLEQLIDKIPGMSMIFEAREAAAAKTSNKRKGKHEKTAEAGVRPVAGTNQPVHETKESNRGLAVESMKRWFVVMDSMTQRELDSDHALYVQQPERIDRLARGSGVPRITIEQMIEGFRKMAVQMRKGMQELQKMGIEDGEEPDGKANGSSRLTITRRPSARQQSKQNKQARQMNEMLGKMMGQSVGGTSPLLTSPMPMHETQATQRPLASSYGVGPVKGTRLPQYPSLDPMSMTDSELAAATKQQEAQYEALKQKFGGKSRNMFAKAMQAVSKNPALQQQFGEQELQQAIGDVRRDVVSARNPLVGATTPANS